MIYNEELAADLREIAQKKYGLNPNQTAILKKAAQAITDLELIRTQWEEKYNTLRSLFDDTKIEFDNMLGAAMSQRDEALADRERPFRGGGNPRTPDEAQREYFLVPSSMSLRYPPQYSIVSLDNLDEIRNVKIALKQAGVKVTIYDRNGNKVPK